MHSFIRASRIVAGLMLMGAGLGLIGALVHTEGAMNDRANVSSLTGSRPQAQMPARRPSSGAILVRVKTIIREPVLHHAAIRQAEPRTGESIRRRAPVQAR